MVVSILRRKMQPQSSEESMAVRTFAVIQWRFAHLCQRHQCFYKIFVFSKKSKKEHVQKFYNSINAIKWSKTILSWMKWKQNLNLTKIFYKKF